MLRIIIEGEELFDEESETFTTTTTTVVDLEHSLVSLSKWESKHEKPFLSKTEKSNEELFDYIKAMIVDDSIDPEVLNRCSPKNLEEIQEYINSSQSATTFGKMPERKGLGETITSELVYYWMVAYTIPFECERWHLNRLFSLIRICNVKNSPQKKVSRQELAQRNRELNAQRRAQLGTKG
jgi:hypothetical protein